MRVPCPPAACHAATVANLLQPGPGYGTTAQDYTAWYTALRASNITVS